MKRVNILENGLKMKGKQIVDKIYFNYCSYCGDIANNKWNMCKNCRENFFLVLFTGIVFFSILLTFCIIGANHGL